MATDGPGIIKALLWTLTPAIFNPNLNKPGASHIYYSPCNATKTRVSPSRYFIHSWSEMCSQSLRLKIDNTDIKTPAEGNPDATSAQVIVRS